MKIPLRGKGAILLILAGALIGAACEGDADVPGTPGSITPEVDTEPRPVLRDTVRQEQLQIDTIDPPPPAPID